MASLKHSHHSVYVSSSVVASGLNQYEKTGRRTDKGTWLV